MVPSVACKSPDNRLRSVVLPAPLGPTTACSLPRCRSMATLSAASNPPTRRDSPCVRNNASLIVGTDCHTALVTIGDAGKPARKKDHQRDDRRAEQQLPVRRQCRVDLLQGDEHE